MCIDCGCRRKAFRAHGHYEAAKAVWGYEGGKRVIIGYERDPGIEVRASSSKPRNLRLLHNVMNMVAEGDLESGGES